MNLKAERLNRGLSRAEFGRHVGLSREGVRQLEKNGRQPQAATAKRVADFLGVQVTDIWPVDDPNDAPVAA